MTLVFRISAGQSGWFSREPYLPSHLHAGWYQLANSWIRRMDRYSYLYQSVQPHLLEPFRRLFTFRAGTGTDHMFKQYVPPKYGISPKRYYSGCRDRLRFPQSTAPWCCYTRLKRWTKLFTNSYRQGLQPCISPKQTKSVPYAPYVTLSR